VLEGGSVGIRQKGDNHLAFYLAVPRIAFGKGALHAVTHRFAALLNFLPLLILINYQITLGEGHKLPALGAFYLTLGKTTSTHNVAP
jgi:hypothetical protein